LVHDPDAYNDKITTYKGGNIIVENLPIAN